MAEQIDKPKHYISELLTLAMPLIMGNLGIILIGAGDVFVAARYSTDALASISIANSLVNLIFMFGIGLLASISPILSNLRGRRVRTKRYLLSTIILSALVSVISSVLMFASIGLVDKIGFEAKLMPDIKGFIFIAAFSTFGTYLQVALKEFLQSFEIVVFPNMLNIFGVFLNLFLCFVFVFGFLGVPQMGAIGVAYASLLVRSLLGIAMLVYCLGFTKTKQETDFGFFKNVIRIGLPISVAILLESLAFNVITLVVGKESGIFAAAQNLLITLITATFMVPLAISNALAVKVGFANGARNFQDLKKYSSAGIFLGLGFMAVCGICFIAFPAFFIKLFTADTKLIEICVPLLVVGGIFQIFDGLQVSLGGIFKGLKETKIVMFGSLVSYWIFGLPLGFLLAYKFDMNLLGFWVGLAISIFMLSMLFLLLLKKKFKEIERAGYN